MVYSYEGLFEYNGILIWVQVHNVLYGYMTLEVAKRIGNLVGSFIKLDEGQFDGKVGSMYAYKSLIGCGKIFKDWNYIQKGKWNGYWWILNMQNCLVYALCVESLINLCPLAYEKGDLTLENVFGSWPTAGGRKPRLTASNKWLVEEGSLSTGMGYKHAEHRQDMAD
ncbi:unnamed protein product [Cuscuta europaea]|uniref:DUF4283 domain-containing protein n=1 Tax=Cuscuta europaea TaxID=41803 RepID=A0A9P1EDJ8_CUSEU|nr:unnamed protein product [Cuscuta europaea]